MRRIFINVIIGITVMILCAIMLFAYPLCRTQEEQVYQIEKADASRMFLSFNDNKNVNLDETDYDNVEFDVPEMLKTTESGGTAQQKPLTNGSIVEIVKTCYIKADFEWKSGDPVMGKALVGETYTHMSALDGNGHYAIALDDGSIGYIANKCGIIR